MSLNSWSQIGSVTFITKVPPLSSEGFATCANSFPRIPSQSRQISNNSFLSLGLDEKYPARISSTDESPVSDVLFSFFLFKICYHLFCHDWRVKAKNIVKGIIRAREAKPVYS